MSTKVLTEGQVSDMKQNGVNVIFNGCDASVSKDRNLPTTAWLMTCKLEDKEWNDIVMGGRVAVFDSYYDAFGKNVIQRMDWTSGTISPISWNATVKQPAKKGKRKRGGDVNA
tara:strand:- start:106 stop:444 length:339 start_codon:yes stop_codon:yes gene_type:complete